MSIFRPTHRASSLIYRVANTLGSPMPPQDCFLCGATTGAQLVCKECRSDLPRLSLSSCPVCALPTPGGEICGACLSQTPYFDATRSCFRYAFPVDHLIQSLKYRHRLVVADFFARSFLQTLPNSAWQADFMLALPLSNQRLRERGFNQALEIARPMAKHLGLPLLINGYTRVIDTVPQASLPWKERHKNMHGAFECALDLAGKTLVVVDDVMTTGATLNEFARTLKKHGAAKVINWTVARALKD